MGLFDRGVRKTKEGFFQRLSRAVVGKSKVDDDVLDAIEEALVASDMGVDTTLRRGSRGISTCPSTNWSTSFTTR